MCEVYSSRIYLYFLIGVNFNLQYNVILSVNCLKLISTARLAPVF